MSLLAPIQTLIAARIAADDLFAVAPTVSVLSESDGDILSAINREWARCGVVCVVFTSSFTRTAGAECLIRIEEHLEINRRASGTNKTALTLAETVWARLDLWRPADYWGKGLPRSIRMTESSPKLIYEVRVNFPVQLLTN